MSAAGNAPSLRSWPFGFAKQYGVLLDDAVGQPRVIHQGQPGLQVLAALKRKAPELLPVPPTASPSTTPAGWRTASSSTPPISAGRPPPFPSTG